MKEENNKKLDFDVEDSNTLLEFLKQGKIDLIKEFKRPAITSEIVRLYEYNFLNIRDDEFPVNWKYSTVLLRFYLEKNNISKICLMDTYAMTDKILEEYQDIFFKIMENKIPNNWKNSGILFEFCLSKKMLNLAKKFNVFNLSDEIIVNEIEIGAKNAFNEYSNNDNIKDNEISWRYDEKFLKKYHFFDLVKKDIISTYSGELIQILRVDFPENWKDNLCLLKLCFENNEDYLAKKFNLSDLMPYDFVFKYKNNIIDILENNFQDKYKYSDTLFELCLMENKLDLVKKFDLFVIPYDLLNKYKSKIFKILEDGWPENWKNIDKITKLCKENNKNYIIES